jgi:hypothetical protein
MPWQRTHEQITKEWTDLTQAYDELRVQAHLFGMTAKQEMSKLEPVLSDAKQKVETLSQETLGATKTVLAELGRSLNKLRSEVKRN